MRFVLALLMGACLSGPAVAACAEFGTPVVSLTFDSRYNADDPSRSTIDLDAEADAKDALALLDAFVSQTTQQTDIALAADDWTNAACVVQALARWAEADALSDLGTETVALTIGSRLAALALVAAQVLPAGTAEDGALIKNWLTRRMEEQMAFWETAPSGAASGNLRAWAALAAAATALSTGDGVMRGWAAWSVSYVACTAAPDGSLPQEMTRKQLALHYQVHAVGPLVVTAALLERQGVSVMNRCQRALDRIVDFAVTDIEVGGVASQALSGEAQTLDSGFAGLKDFQLAWGEAWLTLRPNATLSAALAERRPLKYSKLGGDQSRIWGGL